MIREVRNDDNDNHQKKARHSHHAGVGDRSRSLPLHPHDSDDRSDEGCKAQPDKPAHKSAFGKMNPRVGKTPLSLTTITSRRLS